MTTTGPLADKQCIVLYDGDCGFCHSSVQFILTRRRRDFYFLPLQSSSARALLASFGKKVEMDTIYLLENQKLYERSSAALRISYGLRGLYPLMLALIIIPKFLRDPVYNFIAKRRHRLRKGFCVVPGEQDAQFFIN